MADLVEQESQGMSKRMQCAPAPHPRQPIATFSWTHDHSCAAMPARMPCCRVPAVCAHAISAHARQTHRCRVVAAAALPGDGNVGCAGAEGHTNDSVGGDTCKAKKCVIELFCGQASRAQGCLFPFCLPAHAVPATPHRMHVKQSSSAAGNPAPSGR